MPTAPLPAVSVVVPCRNEESFIAGCLDSLLASEYPWDRMEVLVVDGMSDDGTRAIVGEYQRLRPSIRLLDNPRRITPTALNIGIRAASGDVIVRMDAHASYPPGYVPALVDWLERSGADNVGGVCGAYPATDSPVARGIAFVLSHPVGVGNAYFRIGTSEPRWVDTVPFGCYRREVFERIGLFDEDLVRNQDDELNHRLIRNGGRILLVPNVTAEYYPRSSYPQLWRMYFQYGYFKPLVVRKLGTVPTARQLLPATLVVSLLATGLLAPWLGVGGFPFLAILMAYAVVIGVASACSGLGFRGALAAWGAFPILHFGYGIGYLRGVLQFLLLGRSGGPTPSSISLSR